MGGGWGREGWERWEGDVHHRSSGSPNRYTVSAERVQLDPTKLLRTVSSAIQIEYTKCVPSKSFHMLQPGTEEEENEDNEEEYDDENEEEPQHGNRPRSYSDTSSAVGFHS